MSPQTDFNTTVGDAVGRALTNEAGGACLFRSAAQIVCIVFDDEGLHSLVRANSEYKGAYDAINRNVWAVEDGLGNAESEQEDEGMEEAELAAEDCAAEESDIEFKKIENGY